MYCNLRYSMCAKLVQGSIKTFNVLYSRIAIELIIIIIIIYYNLPYQWPSWSPASKQPTQMQLAEERPWDSHGIYIYIYMYIYIYIYKYYAYIYIYYVFMYLFICHYYTTVSAIRRLRESPQYVWAILQWNFRNNCATLPQNFHILRKTSTKLAETVGWHNLSSATCLIRIH